MKTAFANLNDSALSIFMEEAGNPQFLKRRLGVAGGAVSQDQDYLNRHAAILKIKEPLEYPDRGGYGAGERCSTPTPT